MISNAAAPRRRRITDMLGDVFLSPPCAGRPSGGAVFAIPSPVRAGRRHRLDFSPRRTAVITPYEARATVLSRVAVILYRATFDSP